MIILMFKDTDRKPTINTIKDADVVIRYNDKTFTFLKDRKTGEFDIKHPISEFAIVLSEYI